MSSIEDQSFITYNAAQCKKEMKKAEQDYNAGKISAGEYDQPIAVCQKAPENADYAPLRPKNNANPFAGIQQFANDHVIPTFKPMLGVFGVR